MPIKEKITTNRIFIGFALLCFIGAIKFAELTEFGLNHGPDFSEKTLKSGNKDLYSELYLHNVKIDSAIKWGALTSKYSLSEENVEWAYECYMNEKRSFTEIRDQLISSGTTIQIVLKKGICKNQQNKV